MADESIADEFKAEESMADVVLAALADNMAYVVRTYLSYEILKYWRKRNACSIYGGEILKYRRKRST